MEAKVYPLLPYSWIEDIKLYTEKEFKNLLTINGQAKLSNLEIISEQFNSDEYNPRDGVLIKSLDELSAFLEAYLARKNGIECEELINAENSLRKKYAAKKMGVIDFGEIYSSFV